ncbi:MAG: PhaM family polyhydroxyalkanoate granule multifunctional regulatory protein [Casimicrobium sp.]
MSTPAGNEPWSAWAESMQKMMSSPAAMNPFAGMMGMPGMPGAGSANAFDPQNMMKALDPVEIDKRIQDLRAVEAWMKLSLSGLEMSIKTMEMQRDAYASFNKMSESASKTMSDTAEAAVAATRGRTVKRAARKR